MTSVGLHLRGAVAWRAAGPFGSVVGYAPAAMKPEPTRLYAFLLIGLISCSLLMWEVLLTRICALRLAFHFSYLVISNALLAIGASGAFLTLYQDRLRRRPREAAWLGALLYVASLLLTYAFLLNFPIDTSESGQLDFSDPATLGRFVAFNLGTAVPFFFGGGVVGMLLTFHAERVNRLYFVDLVGAALGCLLSPLCLMLFGAGGCMLVLALLGLAGAAVATPPARRRIIIPAALAAALAGAALVPVLDDWAPVPGRGILALTREHVVDVSGRADFTRWTATSRIDLISGIEDAGVIYTRGTKLEGLPPVPPEKIIVQDANAGTVLVNFSDYPEALEIIRRSMYSGAVRLKQQPSVLIVGVGGGNDVWAAKAAGARKVKGIELNGAIIDIHERIFPSFTRALVDDPNIEFVVGEGRSMISREREFYDVIQMTGVDTWTGLKSGAYVLAENYLYTQEAIREIYARLTPGGILQIIRMAEEMEALRMVANIDAALTGLAPAPLQRSLIAMHTTDLLMAFLVKKGAFSNEEIRSTVSFLAENGIFPVYLPKLKTGHAVEKMLRSPDMQAFIASYPRNITPTSDDRPYFFNFTRWTDPLRSRELVAEPPHISQGNPFFILMQLLVSAALSLLLVVGPLLRLRGAQRAGSGGFLVYFAGVGLGFIMIEVGMMQKLTVFLGHPIYSITVTLASVLLFAGIGSLVSVRWFRDDPRRAWSIPIGLGLLIGVFLLVWPSLYPAAVGLPLAARISISVAILAPLSLLLGVPFAYGIRLANARNPAIVPWAWAVNGCFSVVGSILTVIVSMTAGFAATLMLAVLIYAAAFAGLRDAR